MPLNINIKKVGKRCGSVCLAFLGSLTVPFLIWVAIFSCFRYVYREWRTIRAGLLAGNLACRLDSDCPPGYECLGGRCLPTASQ